MNLRCLGVAFLGFAIHGASAGDKPKFEPVVLKELRQCQGHTERVHSVDFSPDGKSLASGSEDGTVRVWEVSTGRESRKLDGPRKVHSVAFSPDGKTVMAGGGSKPLGACLLDIATGQHVFGFGETASVAVDFSSGGKRVAVANAESVYLLEAADGSQIRKHGRLGAVITAMAFSPDGKLLGARGHSSRCLHLWEVETGKEVRQVSGVGACFAFSPDGKTVATADRDGGLFLIDVATSKDLFDIPGESKSILHEGEVCVVAFSPDGKLLASGGRDGVVRLWRLASQREVARLAGHLDVYTVEFSPDGKLLASAGEDKTVYLWDLGGVLPKIPSKMAGSSVKEARAYALQNAYDDPDLTAAIEKFFDAPSKETLHAAFLHKSGLHRKEFIEPLLCFLNHKNDEFRGVLIKFLGAYQEPSVAPKLVKLLDDIPVAQATAEVLGELGDKSVLPEVAKRFQHKQEWVRKYAAAAMGKLAGQPWKYDYEAAKKWWAAHKDDPECNAKR